MSKFMSLDMINISKGLKIKQNNVKSIRTYSKNEIRFALGADQINSVKKWTVEIINVKNWFGIGICQRDKIISNNLKLFLPCTQGSYHGLYMICTNGYIWNSNNKEEDGNIFSFPKFCAGDKVHVEYNPFALELTFTLGSFEIKLTGIKNWPSLVPLVVLVNKDDEVALEWSD